MKKLLLIFSFCLSVNLLSAQQYQVGYIPADVNVVCDTNTSISASNASFWFVKDTASITVTGSNNTLYFENATVYLFNNGENNTFYVKGYANHIGLFGTGKHNMVHMEDGNLTINTDSNTAYTQNVTLVFGGNNNTVHSVSNTISFNTGTNNSVTNDNIFNGIAFAYTNAPQNPCGETITGIAEVKPIIEIYPIPAIGNVTFNLQNVGQVKAITIYDVTGKSIEVITNITTDKITLNTSGFSTGIYVYSITLANGKTERGKLFVG